MAVKPTSLKQYTIVSHFCMPLKFIFTGSYFLTNLQNLFLRS